MVCSVSIIIFTIISFGYKKMTIVGSSLPFPKIVRIRPNLSARLGASSVSPHGKSTRRSLRLGRNGPDWSALTTRPRYQPAGLRRCEGEGNFIRQFDETWPYDRSAQEEVKVLHVLHAVHGHARPPGQILPLRG